MYQVPNTIKAGIIGGGGYTAGELIRLLLWHPAAEIAFVLSNSQKGRPVSEVHEDLVGNCALSFTEEVDSAVDVLFLCMGHGQSKAWLAANEIPADTVIIDLSHDFRLSPDWVYGLPELNKAALQKSKRIANCGCFATAIQLGLLPLAQAGLLKDELHVQAITGSTGAGQSPQATSHFSWRNNNLSVYKPFTHQHLAEIRKGLLQLQPDFDRAVNFIPIRGDFPRGIFASMYLNSELTEATAYELYESFYQDAVFTHVSRSNPNLKQVINTNRCLVHLEKHGNKLLIISLIDNLVKGASGQAVQNMNLAFGLEETAGLRLKALVF